METPVSQCFSYLSTTASSTAVYRNSRFHLAIHLPPKPTGSHTHTHTHKLRRWLTCIHDILVCHDMILLYAKLRSIPWYSNSIPAHSISQVYPCLQYIPMCILYPKLPIVGTAYCSRKSSTIHEHNPYIRMIRGCFTGVPWVFHGQLWLAVQKPCWSHPGEVTTGHWVQGVIYTDGFNHYEPSY